MTLLLGLVSVALMLALITTMKMNADLSKQVAVADTALEAAEIQFDQFEERERGLYEQISQEKITSASRVEAYENAVSAANNRWLEASRQNANLAEQLASIRVAHPEAMSESEMHIDEVKPRIPFSPELDRFIGGLVSETAREAATEFADIRRDDGLGDEQILAQLEAEWTY
jgi:hypothetical protein